MQSEPTSSKPPDAPKKPKESPPTPEELERALPDLFYAANQCAAFHFWYLMALPVLKADRELADQHLDLMIQNGVVEATLLFVRKAAEFFKPSQPGDKPDSIYSYRYEGYIQQEWIVPFDPTYIELHKRVGHITVRQARYGQMEWPVFPMVQQALMKWTKFFNALAAIPSPANPRRAEQCAQYAQALEKLLARMENDVKKAAELEGQKKF